MSDPKNAVTPIGPLNFVNLFEPKAAAPGAEPRYSMIIGFDSRAMQTAAYQNLRKAVMAAISDKWGEAKAQDANFVRSLRLPFRNAAEKEYAGFDQFDVFISPWSKEQPGVVDVQGNEIVVAGDVWSGQLGRATVRAFAYDNSGNRGVAFSLQNVQIVKADMPRMDSRVPATAAFKNVDDSELEALGIDKDAAAAAANALLGGSSSNDLPF